MCTNQITWDHMIFTHFSCVLLNLGVLGTRNSPLSRAHHCDGYNTLSVTAHHYSHCVAKKFHSLAWMLVHHLKVLKHQCL